MNSFEQLLADTNDIYDNELRDYFVDYFVSNNFDDYLFDEEATSEDIESIKYLFDNDENILLRSINVLNENPFCLEANYVLYGIGDDEIVSDFFKQMYERKDSYYELSKYQKKCYLWILHFYSEYLLDIHSIKKAIGVLNTRISLNGYASIIDIDRLSYMYCLLEDKEGFVSLYEKYGFLEPLPYLLLITVLLKCDDDDKAKEVYSELINRYEYATYIDHLWDLEGNDDEEAIVFRQSVELAFEEICSVPHFFQWCTRNKIESYRS